MISARQADIYLSTEVYIGAKSWSENTLLTNFAIGQDKLNQLSDYLKNISSINQLQYWFDIKKMNNEDRFKYHVQQALSVQAVREQLFNAIWENPFNLRNQVFPVHNTDADRTTAENEFAAMIADSRFPVSNNLFIRK